MLSIPPHSTRSCPCPIGHRPSPPQMCSAAFSLTQVMMLPVLSWGLCLAVPVTLLHFIMLSRTSPAILLMSFTSLCADETGKKKEKGILSICYLCRWMQGGNWKMNHTMQVHTKLSGHAGTMMGAQDRHYISQYSWIVEKSFRQGQSHIHQL